ncbi:MAG: hypothetical protein HY720_17855 [Planctomycetes bacterium]|nr:hypothetical protein [Planctomycetota bacterium]
MPRVAVIGWAQSRHRVRNPDLAPAELVYETVAAALAHARVGVEDIDVVIGAGDDVLDGRSISNVFVAESEGAYLKEETKVEEDGAFAAAYAWMRIAAGAGRTALVVAYGMPSQAEAGAYSALQADPFYQRPLGIDAEVAAALAADAYASAAGLLPREAARVAIRDLAAAFFNPHAVRGGHLDIEEILEADRVAGDLGVYDLPATADGCCAVVLASEEFAREHGTRSILIRGLGWATDAYYLGHRDLARLESARLAAGRAYEMAGVREPAAAFDLAELSPASTYHELMLLEALGFAPEGKAAAWEGRTRLNPSGGPLGADPVMATGLVRIAEAATQLAGEGGDRQVKGQRPRTALAHGACGLAMQSNVVFCLEAGDGAGAR